jgi:hypothetical protein
VACTAIARLDDVDKDSVKVEKTFGSEGPLAFSAAKGKSLDLEKIYEALKATRLPRSGSKLIYLEITALGEVTVSDKVTLLKVSGTTQQFALGEDPDGELQGPEKGAFQRLQQSLVKGEKVVSVTGRVHGWSGHFPDVLKAEKPAVKKPPLLIVTDFQTLKQ